MAIEREWKFHVTSISDAARARLIAAPSTEISQGYLSSAAPVVRVRVRAGKGSLTIKWPANDETRSTSNDAGPRVSGELEYEIPLPDASTLMNQSLACIKKTRYLYEGLEVDVFGSALTGLILVEREVDEGEPAPHPPIGWLWTDVSTDIRFTNLHLALHGVPKVSSPHEDTN